VTRDSIEATTRHKLKLSSSKRSRPAVIAAAGLDRFLSSDSPLGMIVTPIESNQCAGPPYLCILSRPFRAFRG
jgi:hypothetical protein